MNAFTLPLFCPACRGFDAEGAFRVHPLEHTGSEWRCIGCDARYDDVEGIAHIIGPNASRAEARPVPSDIHAWCRELEQSPPGGDEAREAWLLTLYALSHHPEACPSAFVVENMSDQGALEALLRRWLSTHGPIEGDALELGCGIGGHASVWADLTSGTVTLSDLRPRMLALGRALHRGQATSLPWRSMAQRYEPCHITPARQVSDRVHYVVADALDPPFAAEHFKLLSALNLLDTVRDPWMLLGQMDALTATDGLLLLGQPFHYEAHAQHPEGWFQSPEGLIGALQGELTGLEHLSYEILEVADGVPWSLPSHARLVHRYAMHLVLARKRA